MNGSVVVKREDSKMKLYQLKRGTLFTFEDETYWFIKCDGMYAQICKPEHKDTQLETEVGLVSCSMEVEVSNE